MAKPAHAAAQGGAACLGRGPSGACGCREKGGGGLMPLDGLHRRIASIALRAAARYGFALGGGNALIAHGVIDRPTRDVDLVTNRETGVKAAAGPVETALRREGFTTQRQDRGSDLTDIFPGLGDELADWTVTAPGGRRTDLQLAYFDRSHEPVPMDVGPVL